MEIEEEKWRKGRVNLGISSSYVKHVTAKLSEVAETKLARSSSTAINSLILPLKDNENDVPPIATRSEGPCR